MFNFLRIIILFALLFSFFAHAVPVEEYKVIKTPKSDGYSENNFSSSKEWRNSIYGGFDVYSRSVNKTSSVATGKKDLASPFQYPFLISYTHKLSADSRYWAQLGYTIFPKQGPDGGTEESHFFFKVPYSRKFTNSNYEWKAGLVFHQTRIAGQGRAVDQYNGTSSRSYVLPDGTRTSSTLSPEIGLIYEVNKILLQSSLIIEAPFNYKSRTVSLLLGISWNIGGF
jgi:hypothetical protein